MPQLGLDCGQRCLIAKGKLAGRSKSKFRPQPVWNFPFGATAGPKRQAGGLRVQGPIASHPPENRRFAPDKLVIAPAAPAPRGSGADRGLAKSTSSSIRSEYPA